MMMLKKKKKRERHQYRKYSFTFSGQTELLSSSPVPSGKLLSSVLSLIILSETTKLQTPEGGVRKAEILKTVFYNEQ